MLAMLAPALFLMLPAGPALAAPADLRRPPAENAGADGPPPKDDAPAERDYLKARSIPDFLAALEAPDTRAPLAGRKAFLDFLRERKVPEEVVPGFMALHQLLDRASPRDKAELGHLLPTAARLLLDGHAVAFDEKTEHLYGSAESGAFDLPAKVSLTAKAADLDPLLAAEVLAHELQHAYDQYVQRTWPDEAIEMRARKAGLLAMRLLKSAEPRRYAELRRGDSEESRELLRQTEACLAALDAGPKAFAQAVGFGPCASNAPERAMSMGRFSLKGALDPESGEPAQLDAVLASMEREGRTVAALTGERESVRQSMRKRWTRELDLRLKDVEDDLAGSQQAYYEYERDAVFREALIRRMTAELDWLRRKEGPDALYDLRLQVDRDFTSPPAGDSPTGPRAPGSPGRRSSPGRP